MNDSFATVKSILTDLKSQYASLWGNAENDPAMPITERDIVADIRHCLTRFCDTNDLHVHCEIRPAPDTNIEPDSMKRLPRIDVVVLQKSKGQPWFAAAKELQGKYQKGDIRARFSSVPIEFFHTAIEAKIQSDVADAKKDIDKLKEIRKGNQSCNCFFVLLNARGRVRDHDDILAYGQEKEIEIIEYTACRGTQSAQLALLLARTRGGQ
jgi:hypothetical protein